MPILSICRRNLKAVRVIAVAAAIGLTGAAAAAAPAPDGFADLAERLSPSVVNISTRQQIDDGLPKFPPGSPLERFNEYFGGSARTASSLGSGFIIDPSGVIVTNNHVIEGADEIEVALLDGRTLSAEVVGRDAETDLAVLKVKTDRPLPSVRFADSDGARVGDWVVAIGNPFGVGQSVSVGVISARNRDINAGAYDDFIQTDAAINRGNSGGPLFNLAGDVIGVNSAILSPTGGSVGIGFAIPANLATAIVDQLQTFGETRRGWLGVGVQPVTESIADSYGLQTARGALITRVTRPSPASDAGLRPGDLIVRFNGEEVVDDRMLTRLVAESGIGRAVDVEFVRERERLSTSVTIIQLDDDGGSSATQALDDPDDVSSTPTVLGFAVAPITDALRRRYGLDPDQGGVVVTRVDRDSDAEGQVQVGDVVQEIAWRPVTTPEEAVQLARDGSNDGVPVVCLVLRGEEPVYVSIKARR